MGTTIAFCIGLSLGLFCGASLGYSLRKEYEADEEFGDFEKLSGKDSARSPGDSCAVEEISEGSE